MTKRVLETTLLLVFVTLGGCQDSPSTSFLDPTGTPPQPPATGSISGTILFPGDTTPPYPVAAVYAVLGADPSCRSAFGSIHVTGNYTDPEWDSSIWNDTPGMTQVVGCVWFDTITLAAKQLAWKFVVDKNYDPSYGTATGHVGLEGETELVRGTETDLKADIVTAGAYTFILNESESPVTYRIVPRGEAPIDSSDATTRAFRIANLPNGTYTVAIFAPGFPARRVPGVRVTGGDTPIGEVSLTGAIVGRVRFEGDPNPRPVAAIEVTNAGQTAVVATAQTDSAFAIGGLSSGTYDLHFSASGHRDTTVAGVVFTEGEETDVGDVTMRRSGAGSITGTIVFQGLSQPPYPVATVYAFAGVSASCATDYSSVHVTGNHTSPDWSTDHWNTTPGMTPITNCLWIETIQIDPESLNDYGPGVLGWKFILDKQWDPAYGRPAGGGGGLQGRTELVTGTGTELQATLPAEGDWVFILDETSKPGDVRYRLVLVDDAPLGYSDASTRRFTVDRLDPATYELIVTAPGYQRAKLREVPLSGNSFDIGDISLVPAGR